jgi:hypothetical protein
MTNLNYDGYKSYLRIYMYGKYRCEKIEYLWTRKINLIKIIKLVNYK